MTLTTMLKEKYNFLVLVVSIHQTNNYALPYENVTGVSKNIDDFKLYLSLYVLKKMERPGFLNHIYKDMCSVSIYFYIMYFYKYKKECPGTVFPRSF